jgi:hypothetical protein
MHLGKAQGHDVLRTQFPLSGLVLTLLELAGCAAVLACAGAGVGAGAGFAGAGFGAAGGMYSGPLLPQPEIAANARQAGNSRIDRRMMQNPWMTHAV